MSKSPEYWKAYRLKNKEKLQAYEKSRNAKRRARMPLEPSKPTSSVNVAEDIPKTRKCQMSYCNQPGSEVFISGMKAWLCGLHARL